MIVCFLALCTSEEVRLVLSKLNRIDEKLDLLTRKVTMLQNGTGTGVYRDELPALPSAIEFTS